MESEIVRCLGYLIIPQCNKVRPKSTLHILTNMDSALVTLFTEKGRSNGPSVKNRRKHPPNPQGPRTDRVRNQDLPQTRLRWTRNTIRDQRERRNSLRTGVPYPRGVGAQEMDTYQAWQAGRLRGQRRYSCR